MFVRYWRAGLLVLLAAATFLQTRLHAQETTPSEYEFKAAFLHKFANFVGWPTNTTHEPAVPFVMGVLGDDPFGSALEKTIADNTVHGRPVLIRRAKELSDLKDCHLIFIGSTEKKRLLQIMEGLSGSSVLTVSEVDHFCEAGGMINFKKVGKNLRFEVNPAAAERAKLKISSQLLKLAIIIKDDGSKK